MKNKITLSNFKAICIAFSLFLTVPSFAQVAAFDNDKPATTVASTYTQDFSQAWDNTAFYNQWDAAGIDVFTAADATLGYLKFVWPSKRILISKNVNSIPYTMETDFDYNTGASNRAGVVLRVNPTGTPGTQTYIDDNADLVQQPPSDPGYNSVGIAFYSDATGANMNVQFSANYVGSTVNRTQILVPKPTGVTSLLDRGILKIEDFGATIYVYYNGNPYIRINLGSLVSGVYSTGEVFDANMVSKGTFSGMNVASTGKVSVNQRDATLRLYKSTIKTLTAIAPNPTYDFEGDTSGVAPANVSAANGTFTTDSDVARTKTLQLLSADTGNTAIVNLDLFPSAANYSVTWQENYVTKLGRAGMLLRGGTLTNTTNPGLKEGYLFQANPGQTNLRIFKVASVALPANGYTGLTNVSVAAPALGANRWYRATVNGSSLKFEYSDNGTTFTTAGTFTDTSYTSGLTQFASGYGFDIGNLLVDNIVFTPIVTLSVAKNELKNLTLYPNPARDTVNLLFDTKNGETSTIAIYDIQGKLVKTIENKFENNATIDVSSLKKGVYFLKIQSASAEQTKKLIIE